MSYEVKKGLITGTDESRGRKAEYPFASMELGDAFDVPLAEAGRAPAPTTPIMNAARYYRTYGGNPTFEVRCSTKLAPGFVRCWRIK